MWLSHRGDISNGISEVLVGMIILDRLGDLDTSNVELTPRENLGEPFAIELVQGDADGTKYIGHGYNLLR
jgi:hypothetical protein